MAFNLFPEHGTVTACWRRRRRADARRERRFLLDGPPNAFAPAETLERSAAGSESISVRRRSSLPRSMTNRRPIYWDLLPCEAVRDGVVVQFAEAVAAVRALASEAAPGSWVEVVEAASAFRRRRGS